ncbi:MAG TPA: hypothetical protein VIL97_01800 [Thermoanaerobaculia bacterium]
MRPFTWGVGSSGAVLLESDIESIRASHYLYARKFDTTVDATILDTINRDLLAPPRDLAMPQGGAYRRPKRR